MDTRPSGRPTSPTSELLKRIGMTREDLRRHSEQMRQFLTHDQPSSGRTFTPQPEQSLSRAAKSRSNTISRANSVANASGIARSPVRSVTPVKAEPMEGPLPPRQMDTMELVMERKTREKKERRHSTARSCDARRVQRSTPSTSHNATPRASARVSSPMISSANPSGSQDAPETPHHYRYYSERVVSEATASHQQGSSPCTPRAYYKTPEPTSRHSKTPGRHIYSFARSSDRASSPCSSPTRVVNMVSSPGLMRSSPLPEDEVELPYILPPGPYSDIKPDIAYAGLIGQAILSSPQHRLSLQDIYEWITTVYPYYKRHEQTWMNSVRHCLSTMAVFRKVPRGRETGKSLWAIFDQDLECFAGGGFRKSLCADMVKADQEKASKRGTRKRGTMDDGRDTKRRKKNDGDAEPVDPALHTNMFPAPVLPPYFPPFHPNPHHQPYYQAYLPQPIPAEVIFPPLPPSSNLYRATTAYPSEQASPETLSMDPSGSTVEDESTSCGRDPSPKPISSSSSVPALTPNCSSSSSPPIPSQDYITEGEIDARSSGSPDASPQGVTVVDPSDDELENDWSTKLPSIDSLAPSVTLLNGSRTKNDKGKGKAVEFNPRKHVNVSPTMERRLPSSLRRVSAGGGTHSPLNEGASRLASAMTPPRRFITPPRKQQRVTSTGSLNLSPTRTPISHAGLHMSPSPSLAHYKNHLDPPPPVSVFLPQAPLLSVPLDGPRTPPSSSSMAFPVDVSTPSRKRTGHASASGSGSNPSPFGPVTPKRYAYPGDTFESPFRTPSRFIYDPYDPHTILNEELSRQTFEVSPVFGESRRLLEESPTGSSLRTWDRFW